MAAIDRLAGMIKVGPRASGLASLLSAAADATRAQTGQRRLAPLATSAGRRSRPLPMSGGFVVVGDNLQGNLAVWTSLDGTKWQPATIEATSEELGRSLAVAGSRAIGGGRTVGTGMGGDRAVFRPVIWLLGADSETEKACLQNRAVEPHFLPDVIEPAARVHL